ncbi:MAG TPA: dynamin family protein [Terriglobales bacterium]|nr:dynamin family protein [Terriglobales bacterium]
MTPNRPNPPRPLNPHQQRHLYFGLAQVDKLLGDIEGILAAVNSRTLFPRYGDDLSVAQRKLLEGGLARLRASLAALLASQGMRPDRPRIEASGAIRTTLIFAEIAAEELGPASMRGYGDLGPEQAQEVEGVVAELRQRIAALLAELAPEPAAQLQARVAALAASPARAALALLEQVTRERGLLEFRAGLNLLASRMAAPAMEIAVFGRVSCGKSSLLNYLLGADILPTGATPITAVPTRVGYGPEPLLTAQLERQEKRFPLDQLAALASEQQNPDNRLGVTRLSVSYPSPRLRPGVIFVDTPGLGSIRSWGAIETLAYLPRCDMAILLVDAGSTLGGDEVELVRWLHQGGVPVQVVLSKADLVGAAEREQCVRFTREVLARETGESLPVRAVSVRRRDLADDWFEQEVLPLYAALQERFQAALDRRLAVLRDGVVAALRGDGAGGGAPDRAARPELERQLRLAEAEAEKTREVCRGLDGQLAESLGEVIAALAEGLLAAWQAAAGADLPAAGGEALGRAMVAQSRTGLEALHRLAETYRRTLRQAQQALPGLEREPSQDEFAARDLPMPEVGPLPLPLRPPGWAWRGESHARAHFRRQLEAHADAIAAALRRYGVPLQQRALAAQAEMARQFQARADLYRAALQRLSGALGPETHSGPELQRQLEQLQAWQPQQREQAREAGGPRP